MHENLTSGVSPNEVLPSKAKLIRLDEPFLLFDPKCITYEHFPQLDVDTIHADIVLVEPEMSLRLPIIAEAGFAPNIKPSTLTQIQIVVRLENLDTETLAKLAKLLMWDHFNLSTQFPRSEFADSEHIRTDITESDSFEYYIGNGEPMSLEELYAVKGMFGKKRPVTL
jgi:hypothetical protein